jgi:hypothetical protein
MNVTSSLDNKLDKKSKQGLEDDEKTPTNTSSETLVKFTLGAKTRKNGIMHDGNDNDDDEEEDLDDDQEEEEDQNDNTLDENQSNNIQTQKETYSNNRDVNNRYNLINSYSHSLPQLRINNSMLPPPFPPPPIYNHHHMIQPNYPPPPLSQIQNFNGMINKPLLNTPNSTNNHKQHLNNPTLLPMTGLYNDMKLNSIHFHNLETFNLFIRYSLNLNQDLIKELITNAKVQFWIDRNKSSGFIYQAYPKVDESKRKIPPVRCELCKFYGHLSHTCTIKDVNKKFFLYKFCFKIFNFRLKK